MVLRIRIICWPGPSPGDETEPFLHSLAQIERDQYFWKTAARRGQRGHFLFLKQSSSVDKEDRYQREGMSIGCGPMPMPMVIIDYSRHGAVIGLT